MICRRAELGEMLMSYLISIGMLDSILATEYNFIKLIRFMFTHERYSVAQRLVDAVKVATLAVLYRVGWLHQSRSRCSAPGKCEAWATQEETRPYIAVDYSYFQARNIYCELNDRHSSSVSLLRIYTLYAEHLQRSNLKVLFCQNG